MSDESPKRLLHPETLAIRTQSARTAEREHSVPLFLTSSFVFEVTGGTEKIDKFLELMREVGLIEVARTGVAAIARGHEVI